MKKVRRNDPKCLTGSKNRDESHENDPFFILPLDLIVEILIKFPVKCIARLVFVSKRWSSLIGGKDFINLYMTRSSTRPRILFLVNRISKVMQLFESCSQEDPSSDHRRVDITWHQSHLLAFSPPVRGLICRQCDTKVMIGNPSTGQFLTLPKVKTRRRGIYSFLGYDPVNDIYKMLCMTVLHVRQRRGSQIVSDEHQVFTLGAKQKWRTIECKHPHLPPPLTKGICINGVVYYYAWIKSEGSLISFDVSSEEFNVIRLPEDIRYLVNYNGKIALPRQSNSTLNLWILEDASKQDWTKVSLLVPSWTDLVGTQRFGFKGTISTGELIFTSLHYPCSSKPFFFISYDLKENNAKKVVVGGIGYSYASMEFYFGHVESPMFLSNVS